MKLPSGLFLTAVSARTVLSDSEGRSVLLTFSFRLSEKIAIIACLNTGTRSASTACAACRRRISPLRSTSGAEKQVFGDLVL